MKTFIIAAFTLLSLSSNAQIFLNAGDYLTDNTLDKFIGTWRWVNANANDTIIIKLKKIKYLSPAGDFSDILRGTHSYSKNGLEIENYLSKFDIISPTKGGTVGLAGKPYGTNPNKVRGGLKDNTKHKWVELRLEYNSTTPPQIIWHLEPYEGTILPPKLEGQTLPKDIILIKQ
jgi:hypothetical protein